MSYNDMMQTEELFIILIIVIMSLIGSLSKDYINFMRKEIPMKVGRIITSTICSSMITYTFSMYILDKLYFRGLIGISYFCGLLGFELVNKLSNLSGVIHIIKLINLDPDKLEKIEENLEKLEKELDDKSAKKEEDGEKNKPPPEDNKEEKE